MTFRRMACPEANKYYQYAAELAPGEFRWTYYLGVVEADQGQCEQAVSNLHLALRIDQTTFPQNCNWRIVCLPLPSGKAAKNFITRF